VVYLSEQVRIMYSSYAAVQRLLEFFVCRLVGSAWVSFETEL
jgi:hypothetical protein